jgi:phenylacetate-CoA ligase
MKFIHVYDFIMTQRAQWKTRHKIDRIQQDRLARLIQHAWNKVPYYRDLMSSAGLRPEDIRSRDDLRMIPITTKRALQNVSLKDKIAAGTDIDRCRISHTSGTTGAPLKIYAAAGDVTRMNLSWARAYLSNGMEPWYKIAAFIGQSETIRKRSWYEYLGIWKRHEISTWKDPEDWIKEIRHSKPDVLVGYVMTLKLLAEAIQANGVHDIRPKLIYHSSAILDDASRRFLESVFRVPVIDFYGADEAGCIAWECPRCSLYHINSDMVLVEIQKDGTAARPGEAGEILITNLQSYAMPFIRYALGDVGVLSDKIPFCGRGLPLMEKIQGRMDDFIILPNKRKLPPHPLYHCLDPVPGIRRWRIIQTDIHHLVVELERGRGFSAETVSRARANLIQLLKSDIDIVVRAVPSIPIPRQTKFRAIQSELSQDL